MRGASLCLTVLDLVLAMTDAGTGASDSHGWCRGCGPGGGEGRIV